MHFSKKSCCACANICKFFNANKLHIQRLNEAHILYKVSRLAAYGTCCCSLNTFSVKSFFCTQNNLFIGRVFNNSQFSPKANDQLQDKRQRLQGAACSKKTSTKFIFPNKMRQNYFKTIQVCKRTTYARIYSPWQLRSLEQKFSLFSFCAAFAGSLHNLGALTFRLHN